MPSPRLPGLGVEKILISSHEIPEDHILYFIVLACSPSKPGVRFFASRLWFFFFLGCSSPGLPLAVFRAPLPFSSGCPTVSSEVSHFIAVITLHLGGVPAPFSLRSMVSIPWGEWGFLVLLVTGWRFIVSHRKSALHP